MAICPKCGTNVADPNAQFCPNCGATMSAVLGTPSVPPAPASATPAWTPPAGSPMMVRQRPTGVTILAILAILSGLAGVGGGAVILALGSFAAAAGLTGLGGLVVGLGALLLILGLAYFGVAFGLWTGKPWGWTVAMIVAVVSIIVNIATAAVYGGGIGSGVIGIIIDLIILYYLTRPHVRAYFGKAPMNLPGGM
jgi:hypothetical protein